MTLNKDGLEAAHAAYERYGHTGDLRTQRLSDGCVSAVITAYLATLPAPDGLVEKLRTAVQLATSMGARGQHASNIYNLAEEAATVIQTLQRSVHELEERVSALEAERQNLIATKREQITRLTSRAEAAEQQVRDMREGLEPFAEVGRMLNDEDGWADTDTLQIGADPEFPNFHEISAGAFRRARLLLKEGGE